MGDDPLHGPGPGEVLTQGFTTDNREAAHVAILRETILPSSRDGDAGSGVQRDRVLYAEEAEYGSEIHCDTTNYGTLQEYGADNGDMGGKKVLGTGGPKPGGRKGSDGFRKIREWRGRSCERGYGVAGN